MGILQEAFTRFFGVELDANNPKSHSDELPKKAITLPQNDDGAVVIQSGAYYGVYVDLDGVVRNEVEQITKYREMALQPEMETAIDEIVNEAIVVTDDGVTAEINMDKLELDESIKKKIEQEFEIVLSLLDFGNMGHDLFRRWYIDGRLFYQAIIDDRAPSALKKGIIELRYIDPRRIRKVREIEKTKDPATGIEIIKSQKEYYLYNERGIIGTHTNLGAKITVDTVINVNSGLMDPKRAMVLSYLHKAIKPLNQLRMMEDATVIYRMSRAPERRIFYIDTGNLPTVKAQQYVQDIMTKYRNKLVYDINSGELKDDRKHLSMLEDYWLPRREGSKGTEIGTLPGGQNLGELEDVKYFEKKLYKSLGVPMSRLEQNQGFSLGRTTEITRDELKFTKFVQRLRNKFSTLFDEILRRQLVMKNIIVEADWKAIQEKIHYDFKKDNNFDEIKEQELTLMRYGALAAIDPYVGRYVSAAWVRKNILKQTDDEMEEMNVEIAAEQQALAGNPAAVLQAPTNVQAQQFVQQQEIDQAAQVQAKSDLIVAQKMEAAEKKEKLKGKK